MLLFKQNSKATKSNAINRTCYNAKLKNFADKIACKTLSFLFYSNKLQSLSIILETLWNLIAKNYKNKHALLIMIKTSTDDVQGY